jgi:transposase
MLAKTDRVDAEMLARMARQLDLKPTPALSPAVETLKELRLARRALGKDRTAAKNRASG